MMYDKIVESNTKEFTLSAVKSTKYKVCLGSYINDVTVLGGRGSRFFVTRVLRPFYLCNKKLDDGAGAKKCSKLLDVIYGRPLS